MMSFSDVLAFSSTSVRTAKHADHPPQVKHDFKLIYLSSAGCWQLEIYITRSSLKIEWQLVHARGNNAFLTLLYHRSGGGPVLGPWLFSLNYSLRKRSCSSIKRTGSIERRCISRGQSSQAIFSRGLEHRTAAAAAIEVCILLLLQEYMHIHYGNLCKEY